MLNDSHLENWFGLPVEDAAGDAGFPQSGKIYRFAFSYDDEEGPWENLETFLDSPAAPGAVAIVFGMDEEPGGDGGQDAFLDVLEKHREKLANLRGIFLGDIVQEENEISWIKQGDISRALRLFPKLEELRSRGQDGLVFEAGDYPALKKLVIETGGIPAAVLEGIAGSSFPGLEHLELWLGSDEYGFDGSIDDVKAVLDPAIFPNVKHLALGNSSIQNEVVAAILESPLLDQLETLDLSLGTMTDEGAVPLLEAGSLKNLKKLNLHRNFLSAEMQERLKGLAIEVDVDGQETPDSYNGEIFYYVAVGE